MPPLTIRMKTDISGAAGGSMSGNGLSQKHREHGGERGLRTEDSGHQKTKRHTGGSSCVPLTVLGENTYDAARHKFKPCYLYSVDLYSSIKQSFVMKKSQKASSQKSALLCTLACNIRKLRKDKGISQEELAEITGLHRTYVGAIERAERNITLSSLEAFAKAFNLDAPLLLQEKAQNNE